MARRFKTKTIDDGAEVRVHQKQPYQGSQILDSKGQPRPGSPLVEVVGGMDEAKLGTPHPFDPRVLDGSHPQKFQLDTSNRPVIAEAKVLPMSHIRNDDAQRATSGDMRRAGADSDATHLVARTLGGPGGFENLVPASELTNRVEIRALEKDLENMVAADPKREIFMQVHVEYGGDHAMPTALHYFVFEQKDGKLEQIMPDQSFYASH